MAETLDSTLKARVRDVLDRGPVTETQLRSLSEEGQAWRLILTAQLEREERHLDELSADPTSSLIELADAYRSVSEIRPDVDELESLLGELEARARSFRASWLGADGRAPRRGAAIRPQPELGRARGRAPRTPPALTVDRAAGRLAPRSAASY